MVYIYPTDELLEEEVRLCKIFIDELITPRNSLNRDRAAYNLKHKVEGWTRMMYNKKEYCTYIDEDSFIKAAKEKGYEPFTSSGVTYFKMSFKKLNKWTITNFGCKYACR